MRVLQNSVIRERSQNLSKEEKEFAKKSYIGAPTSITNVPITDLPINDSKDVEEDFNNEEFSIPPPHLRPGYDPKHGEDVNSLFSKLKSGWLPTCIHTKPFKDLFLSWKNSLDCDCLGQWCSAISTFVRSTLFDTFPNNSSERITGTIYNFTTSGSTLVFYIRRGSALNLEFNRFGAAKFSSLDIGNSISLFGPRNFGWFAWVTVAQNLKEYKNLLPLIKVNSVNDSEVFIEVVSVHKKEDKKSAKVVLGPLGPEEEEFAKENYVGCDVPGNIKFEGIQDGDETTKASTTINVPITDLPIGGSTLTTTKGERKMNIKYLDRFFFSDIDDSMYFSTHIGDNDTEDLLEVCLGIVGSTGLSMGFDLKSPQERQDALLCVRKLTEGFQNLKSALEKDCKDRE